MKEIASLFTEKIQLPYNEFKAMIGEDDESLIVAHAVIFALSNDTRNHQSLKNERREGERERGEERENMGEGGMGDLFMF